jgi:hypothetical protein
MEARVTYDEMLAVLERVRVDTEFAEIWRAESERTIMCHPDRAVELRWRIDQAGADDVLTVVENPAIPPGDIYIIDHNAIEAGMRESLAARPVFNFAPAFTRPFGCPPVYVPPPVTRDMFRISGI